MQNRKKALFVLTNSRYSFYYVGNLSGIVRGHEFPVIRTFGGSSMAKVKSAELFESTPIPSAVFQLAIPAIIGQTINIIYNLADTYFVGQLNDNNQVAAVTLCMPLFLALASLSGMMGVGGGSLLSQRLGSREPEKASIVSGVSFWAAMVIAGLFSFLVFCFRAPLLRFIGADADTMGFSMDYLTWTVCIGGLFTTMNPVMGYLVRAEGFSGQASIGVALGGILNILLDPVFIFFFGLGVKGAAIATCLSNAAAVLYFLLFIRRQRGRSLTVIRLKPRREILDFPLLGEIIVIGLPSFFLSIMSTISNVAATKLMAPFGSAALAAIGVAKKVNSTAFSISQGLGQGVLPLVAYNHSSGNEKRMRGAILFALGVGAVFSLACITVFKTVPAFIISLFLKDPGAIGLGADFLDIICFAIPTTTFISLCITAFQGIGQKKQPYVISLLRKGTLDVAIMMLLTRTSMGMFGIVWATPIAEICTVITALTLLFSYFRKTDRALRAK